MCTVWQWHCECMMWLENRLFINCWLLQKLNYALPTHLFHLFKVNKYVQSHYIEVAQKGVSSSRVIHEWLWIFSLFWGKKNLLFKIPLSSSFTHGWFCWQMIWCPDLAEFSVPGWLIKSEATQYYVHGGLQQLKGSLANINRISEKFWYLVFGVF